MQVAVSVLQYILPKAKKYPCAPSDTLMYMHLSNIGNSSDLLGPVVGR
jgi:hypothetical protein